MISIICKNKIIKLKINTNNNNKSKTKIMKFLLSIYCCETELCHILIDHEKSYRNLIERLNSVASYTFSLVVVISVSFQILRNIY